MIFFGLLSYRFFTGNRPHAIQRKKKKDFNAFLLYFVSLFYDRTKRQKNNCHKKSPNSVHKQKIPRLNAVLPFFIPRKSHGRKPHTIFNISVTWLDKITLSPPPNTFPSYVRGILWRNIEGDLGGRLRFIKCPRDN